jgi:hypothetical protein
MAKEASFVPFTVSNSTAINTELGANALPNGYTQVPIYAYLKGNETEVLVDDIDLYGCNYVELVDERFPK